MLYKIYNNYSEVDQDIEAFVSFLAEMILTSML